MPLKNEALRTSEPTQPANPFPSRLAGYRNPAPPPPSGSLKKLLTFNKSADGALADFPSEKSAAARSAWLVTAALVLVAGGAAAFFFVPRWRVSAAAPKDGQLTIVSQPLGGEVRVDGVLRGVTPLTLSLPSGPHALELRRAGLTRSISVNVKPGAEATHYVDLETAAVPDIGQLIVSSEPPGARVTVDGQGRGVTPVTLSDVAAGLHAVVIQGESGPIQRSVTVQRGQASSLVVSMMHQTAFGWVSVSSPLVVQVLEDDRKLGTSETDRIVMPAGQHTLRIVNTRYGFQTSRVVHVPAGSGATVKIEPPIGVVNLNALPWAEAWIDGRQAGETPLGNFRLPVGDHEVVFRNPQFGERRMAFVVTANEPARVAVDLRK